MSKPDHGSSNKAGPSRRTIIAASAAAAVLSSFHIGKARAAETLVIRDPGGPWPRPAC